jgi:hypothetical protein
MVEGVKEDYDYPLLLRNVLLLVSEISQNFPVLQEMLPVLTGKS